MMLLNLIRFALLSSSIFVIDAASTSDSLSPITKKVPTTNHDESPLPSGTPSDNSNESKSGRCEVLGTVFAEGSAMTSTHECSFCYCIRGQRQCVTPRCSLPLRGCKPRYRSSSCCPTFYDCHDSVPTTTTSTTTTTTTTTEKSTTAAVEQQSKAPASRIGCFIDGQRYFEGQFMPEVGGPCHACYCLRGRQQCTEMRCRPPVKGCAPVMAKGKCCPVRYDCETNENVVSRTNGKLPRGDLLPEFGFKFDFDYDNSDIDDRVMENHVRIERQSENEPQEDIGAIITTELPVTVDEETTVDTIPAVHGSPHPANDTTAEMEILKVSEDPFVKDIENTDEYLSGGDDKFDSELQFVEEPILDDNLQVESNIEDVVHEVVVPYNSSISEIATENPDIDYYYDYEDVKEETTKVPTLSITEILSKLRTQNEGSVGTLADILPAPITGTRVENDKIPEKTLSLEPERNDKTDFVSYDIDVGTSMIAGKDDDIVGVGHVIPIDLHSEDELPVSRPFRPPPSRSTTTESTTSEISTTSTTTTTAAATTTTTTTVTSDDTAPITTEYVPETESISSTSKYSTTEKNKPQSSFLDTFLSLFRGGQGKPGDKSEKPGSSQFAPPPFTEQPPPPFLNPISRDENLNADIFDAPLGPPSFFRPPPLMDDNAPVSGDIFEDEFVLDTKNELDGELDLDSKPTIDNEIRTRPKPPNGSITRNELPIRRRPTTTTGSKPFYPGLFASRPKLTSSNTHDANEAGGVADEHLPTDPFVEGGFAAIRPTSVVKESINEEPVLENEDPTLPPSLPNLKIIPFVAADALVNQGSPPDDGTSGGFSPRPFGSSSATQDCREGGKVWKNGEAVAKGDNDPCVLCRCLLGKVICQHLECPTLPNGCTAEENPAEGECCPKLTCDKSANVSIVDTLPSFRPIKDETEDTPSNPIRPSPFSHQNRRPPFNSSSRRPPISKSSISPRKPLIHPRLRPTKRPTNDEEIKPTEEEEEPSKIEPIRPIRPFSRPPLLKPLRNSVPQLTGSRPRPFSYQNRTGSRPSFVPPRRANPHLLPTTESSDSEIKDDSEFQDVVSQTSTDRTSLLESRFPLREQPVEKEPIKPQRDDPTDFDHLFADLLDKDSLPQPIHRDQPEDDLRNSFGSDRPFILPSEILIPKPLPPQINNGGLDGEITNFVQQDKFRFTENNASPEVKFGSPIRIQKPTKRLPEIPEVVKAQLPLGNDPILVSGLFELGGCNVYGRMFEIGEEIQEISGQCKACQCTKVGVQCLPIC